MKKIIFSLCIAMVAFLSATYVKAKKVDFDVFYGRTFNETYVKINGLYSSTNCADFTGHEDICGYILLPAGVGIVPDTFDDWDAWIFQYKQYLRPASHGEGVYLTE